MAEGLSNLRQQFTTFWQGLPSRKKWLIVGAAGTTLIFLLFAGIWFRQTKYVPLYTNLTEQDAGLIVAKLKEDNIPYEIQGDGSTILVPRQQVYETRIALATAGIPKGGVVGFELFEQNQLGSTEFDRRLKYLWALQGELTRTIRQMAEIEDVRVHIVQPQPSLFVSQENPATASVLLKQKPYSKLSEAQIYAIANLVAGSVEGLTPENVTILDTNGNLLSDFIRPESGKMQSRVILSQLEIKQAYEKEMAKSIQTMLERAFGLGRVVARVNAEMNFNYREANIDSFTPGDADNGRGIVRSEEINTERFQGEGPVSPGGVAGVTENIPGYVGLDQGASEYEKRTQITNYEVNKVQEYQVENPGRIERISAAVWIDGTLTPQQREDVEQTVAAAIGYNPERGDVITVQSMAFDRTWEEAFATPAPSPEGAASSVYLMVILPLLALVGIWLVAKRRQARTEPKFEALVGEEEVAAAKTSEADLGQREDHQATIQRLVRQKPAEVAKVIESWLNEEM